VTRLATGTFIFLLLIDTLVPALIDRLFFNGLSVIDAPGYAGCIYVFANRWIYVDFILVIFTESICLGLFLKKTLSSYGSRSSSIRVMYHDGIFFYVVILCVSVTNLIVILVSPSETRLIFTSMQRVMHSCCCTRILLHIRSAFSGHETRSRLGFVDDSRTVVTNI